MKHFIICLVLAISLFANATLQRKKDDGFNAFLKWATFNYGDWIVAKGLDKVPIHVPETILLPYNRNGLMYDCKISNQAIFGLYEVDRSRQQDWMISSNLLRGHFNVGFYTTGYEMEGQYEIYGTINGSLPITGKGKVTARIGSRSTNITAHMSNFNLNRFDVKNGHIDIRKAYEVSTFTVPLIGITLELEGLQVPGGMEDEVLENLSWRYRIYTREWLTVPVHERIQNYFEEVFRNVSVAEIVGTEWES